MLDRALGSWPLVTPEAFYFSNAKDRFISSVFIKHLGEPVALARE